MRRRLVAWIALFALWSGLAVPAHAYAHLRVPGGMAADFCTTKSAPPAPASTHTTACDACANCVPAGAPPASRSPSTPAADYLHAVVVATADASTRTRAPFAARAPPLLP